MGMYDELNKISRIIEQNKKKDEYNQTQATVNQVKKYNLLSLLQAELMEAEAEGYNLYHQNTKDRIIEAVVENPDASFLHSKDYTVFFLESNYYSKAKAVQNIQKQLDKPRIEAEKEAEKQAKMLEKMQIKQEKEAERLQKEQEKEETKAQMSKKEILHDIAHALKILSCITLAPFIFLVFFIVEVCNSTNTRKRR